MLDIRDAGGLEAVRDLHIGEIGSGLEIGWSDEGPEKSRVCGDNVSLDGTRKG